MVLYKKMERNMENGAVHDHRESRPRRIDVTGTQAYRELYANNLRMYGFLMKKVLNFALLAYWAKYLHVVLSCILINL